MGLAGVPAKSLCNPVFRVTLIDGYGRSNGSSTQITTKSGKTIWRRAPKMIFWKDYPTSNASKHAKIQKHWALFSTASATVAFWVNP